VDLLLGQVGMWKPGSVARFVNELIQLLPVILLVEPQRGVAFLAQNIEPAPLLQLPQDRDRAKFAVSDQENSRLFRQQAANIP
jgi:hypothetical protein